MVQEKVRVSTRTLRWRCVESRKDSKRLFYGRFILSPLMKGQAETIGIAMRRALLGEMEGTSITRAKSEKIPHEYSTIMGIQESIHEILMNLKEIVLRSNLYGIQDASICIKGPGYVTAQDLILPPSVEIVDNTQHIAILTEPVDFCIGLQIERYRGYHKKTTNNLQDGSFPIDAVFMPVRNTNYSIQSYGNGSQKDEILFLEIWTNGSLTPKEALHGASRNLIDLFIPFLHGEEENLHFENDPYKINLTPFTFHNRFTKLKKNKKEIALKSIFIDQLELTPKTYNCLKRYNIHTLLDLLTKSQEELMKMEHFRSEDLKHILNILEKRNCAISFPNGPLL
uniref:RNA polymerase alpha subunit n=1 Tax=Parnassia deqenensis TaxID=1037462 RepID=UPI001FB003F0|nr:RNA polymerase alpha subunit [Parnassia deqenensis]YP_010320973.1 RNA polymerase alpha subunit [Parnassia epunctulata]YP_010321063.1 RNA polymerase alpha subunit [Parnassia tibetana]YP_010456050.1 RNA polymerase alpha subunit [Parnassia pusilla]YP_010458879.1 RNA polymerase alpha subunit [Parnassia mysorensis]UJJ82573.1 RNA polymerase alpha subunit [Parnassia deqenensis]UJP70803.1 RNA polymerase alpha subunit [Parnassia epunctulata]UJP70893.1 RNA polymerase alpha subunit [Parnassia tibeta